MTFSSNSDDFRLPRVGEIWKLTLASLEVRILLVVGPRVYAPTHAPQVEQITLLDLESGRVKRVNSGSVNQKRGYQRIRSLKSFAKLSTFGKVVSWT